MRLKDIMTRKVEGVPAKATLETARNLLSLNRFHHLVVIDGLIVVGVVTADLLQWGTAEGIARVEDVMVRRVPTGTPEMTVRQAANLMRGSAAGALPVIDKDDRLAGIVTVSDLLDLLGRGSERPARQTKRWTLKHRGQQPIASKISVRAK